MSEESDFQQTALSEGETTAPRLNSSNNTIPPAQIAQNANFSDIFPFKFEANESSFLLSNAAVNEQKVITAMYIEATEPVFFQKRNMKLASATSIKHAIENDLDFQKKVENRTTHLVLHVEICYQKNTIELMLQ
ncbi:hypothetical protein G9A89_017530 [Geosiphon pyriformis]|nr:hypothetical protein G9A89_017530 [Geosiphon pyriformis]